MGYKLDGKKAMDYVLKSAIVVGGGALIGLGISKIGAVANMLTFLKDINLLGVSISLAGIVYGAIALGVLDFIQNK